jgi:DnaJ homolog subfamily C member 13
VGVELLEASGDIRWCLDFRDMNSPAIVLLGDSYGRKTSEGGGFVLCPLYGRKSKAFMAASGTTNTAIISHMVHNFDLVLFGRSTPVIHVFCSSM